MNDYHDRPIGSPKDGGGRGGSKDSDRSRSFSRRHGFVLDNEPERKMEPPAEDDGILKRRSPKRRPPTQQFNMRIDVTLFQRLYRFCESRNLTLTEVVEDAIDRVIRDSHGTEKPSDDR